MKRRRMMIRAFQLMYKGASVRKIATVFFEIMRETQKLCWQFLRRKGRPL